MKNVRNNGVNNKLTPFRNLLPVVNAKLVDHKQMKLDKSFVCKLQPSSVNSLDNRVCSNHMLRPTPVYSIKGNLVHTLEQRFTIQTRKHTTKGTVLKLHSEVKNAVVKSLKSMMVV